MDLYGLPEVARNETPLLVLDRHDHWYRKTTHYMQLANEYEQWEKVGNVLMFSGWAIAIGLAIYIYMLLGSTACLSSQ